MQPITTIRSRTVVIPTRDIDTDQIIPARFLTTTSREGLGDNLFHDLRFDATGEPDPAFPLNDPAASGSRILVGGNNFGCGSSREHAPWALLDNGIHAVISTEIADIFRNNALKNGLVPVLVDRATHEYLLENPGIDIAIDIRRSTLTLPDGASIEFPIEAFARHCLVEGIDQLGYLQQQLDRIRSFEEQRSWMP